MNLFLQHPDDMGQGLGFQLFDGTHFLILAAFAIVTLLISVWYVRLDDGTRQKTRLIVGSLALITQIMRMSMLVAQGRFTLGDLPLHLCAMSTMLIFVHSRRPSELMGDTVFMLSLAGGIVSLIFGEWHIHRQLNFYTLQSWFVHYFLVLYVVMLLWSGEIKPRIKNMPKVTLGLLIYSAFIFVLNKLIDTNFLYVNEPLFDTPLVTLEQWMGNPGYIVGLAVLCLVIWFVMYGMDYLVRSFLNKRHA